MTKRITAAKRMSWIEWARGLAAFAVAAHHLVQPVWPWYRWFCSEVFNFGRVGVVAFFIVSGFVIPLSYARQTTSVFIVRRFTRLYPVYWLILGVTIALLVIHGEPMPPLGSILLNATMLQSLVAVAIVGVAWTLSIELLYYFQQIAFKSVKLLDKSWMLGYFWLAVFFAALAAEHILNRELPITVPQLLAISCVGHLWSLYLAGQASKRNTLWFSLIVLIGTCVVPLARAEVDPIWNGYLYSISSIGGIALFIVCYLLRDKFTLSWAVWLGSISYALYLCHSLFLYWIEGVSQNWGWPVFFASLAASIVLSWLLHKYIEQPFMNIGRRYKPRQKPSSPTTSGP